MKNKKTFRQRGEDFKGKISDGGDYIVVYRGFFTYFLIGCSFFIGTTAAVIAICKALGVIV